MSFIKNNHIIKMNQEQSLRQEMPYQLQNLIFTGTQDETIDTHESKSDISIFSNLNRGRVAIFLDGSNLFYAALQLGIEVDYTKLLCLLTQKSQLLRAFFYTGVDRTNEKQQGFLLWMRRNSTLR